MSLGEAVACPVEPDFDPLSPEFLADPSAVMSSLALAVRPVFYAPAIDYHVITLNPRTPSPLPLAPARRG